MRRRHLWMFPNLKFKYSSKIRMEDIPQAHEKAQKFEIAALFPDRKIDHSNVAKSKHSLAHLLLKKL